MTTNADGMTKEERKALGWKDEKCQNERCSHANFDHSHNFTLRSEDIICSKCSKKKEAVQIFRTEIGFENGKSKSITRFYNRYNCDCVDTSEDLYNGSQKPYLVDVYNAASAMLENREPAQKI